VPELIEILTAGVKKGASDVHFVAGKPPLIRVHGEIVPIEGIEPLTADDTKKLVFSVLYDDQRARFEERLRVEVNVPDDLLDLPVPTFVLQPLVENAVKHGIAPVAAGGLVEIRATLEAQQDGARPALVVTVRDTGAGFAARLTGPQGSGILTSMARANALLVVPADRNDIPAGESLPAILLGDAGAFTDTVRW